MAAPWLDRAIAVFSPATAVKRLAARRSFDLLSRGYDGAARGRRTDGWRTSSTSADAEVGTAGQLLADRSRDLTRNNPHAARAVSVLVNNIIGSGIIPRASTDNTDFNDRVNSLWEQWSLKCDAAGMSDFTAMQTLACREMVESGEVLIRRRPRREADGLPVPLQIELLECDFLDRQKTQELQTGGRILYGIEFDPIGRRAGYWLHAQHPGDLSISFTKRQTSAFVAATDVLHIYERQRAQVRGVPWCTPVIRCLRDLDDWTQAELVRKKTEACIAAMVIGADEEEQGIATAVTDSNGDRVESLRPGLIAYLRGGKDVKFNQPSSAGGVGEWLRAQLHIIAAGYRMPYELLTGDLSQVNYSSIRAGLIEFRRLIEAMQWQIVIPTLCQPVWDWFCLHANIAGLLPQSNIAVQWSPPRWDAVDPLKDAQADLLSIRSGTMTLGQAIARQGYNPESVLAEYAQFNALLDNLGIVLDSDPRRVTGAGQIQSAGADQPQGN